jgi:hypothetical protein
MPAVRLSEETLHTGAVKKSVSARKSQLDPINVPEAFVDLLCQRLQFKSIFYLSNSDAPTIEMNTRNASLKCT